MSPSPEKHGRVKTLLSHLSVLCRRFLQPIGKNPGFFTAAVMMGAATPWMFAITQGARILWLIVFATIQSIALSYLLCLLVSLVRNRPACIAVKCLLLAVLGILSLADVATITMTGEALTSDSVNLILETNSHEASGFFTQYLSAKAVATIIRFIAAIVIIPICILLIIGKLKQNRGGRSLMVKALCLVISAIIITGGIRLLMQLRPIGFNDYRKLLTWASQDPGNPVLIRTNQMKFGDPLSKWVYIYKDISLQTKNISAWEETQAKALTTPCSDQPDREFDIIVIIGESFIRQHTPLYGYYLPTTPRLVEERDSGRLVVFSDMITAANFTTTSLRNLLNLNDVSAGEEWYEGVYFPLLARKAGWNVYHYDNQTATRTSDAGIGGVIYSDFNMTHTYNGISDKLFTYDGDYVTYVTQTLMPRERQGKKMVTYHLWGQHFAAADRFPGNPHFTATDITADKPWLDDSRRQAIADYDSATFYNDSVVGAIIDSRRDSPTVLFYFSDHGEDIWDLAPVEARNKPMPEDSAWLDRQYHIPFMVWMSDGFRRDYPDLAQRIRDASDRPGTLDNLGQTVIGIAGITSPYYKPERDMTSPGYKPHPRVTAEGYQYDKP